MQEQKLKEKHNRITVATKRATQKELTAQSILKLNTNSFTDSHRKPGGIAIIMLRRLRSTKLILDRLVNTDSLIVHSN